MHSIRITLNQNNHWSGTSGTVFSLDSENKNAAGTAQETVGHPGSQIPIIANKTKNDPRAT